MGIFMENANCRMEFEWLFKGCLVLCDRTIHTKCNSVILVRVSNSAQGLFL